MISKGFIHKVLKKPQMTSKGIKFVSNLSKEYNQIIEIGCGMSTFIWAKTFKSVIAIEGRLQWYRKIDKILKKGHSRTLIYYLLLRNLALLAKRVKSCGTVVYLQTMEQLKNLNFILIQSEMY
jgi:hypothetical protein